MPLVLPAIGRTLCYAGLTVGLLVLTGGLEPGPSFYTRLFAAFLGAMLFEVVRLGMLELWDERAAASGEGGRIDGIARG